MLFLLLLILSFSLSFSEVVARIDGKVLTKEEFERAFRTYWKEILHFSPGKPRKEDKKRFLFEYIKGMIIEDIALDLGIRVSEEEVRKQLRRWGVKRPSETILDLARREILTRRLEKHLTKDVAVKEEEIKAYYLLNRREFRYPDQVKLLRVVAEDRKTAEEVYRALKKGRPVPDMEGITVGRERWYSIHALPRKIRKRLWPYKVGRVSRPIKLGTGYLILKVLDRRKAGFLPLTEVKDRVRSKILKMKREEVFKRWFRSVLKNYRLEIYLKEL